jgi:hypothetical protein
VSLTAWLLAGGLVLSVVLVGLGAYAFGNQAGQDFEARHRRK